MARVVVLGSLNMDLVVHAARRPAVGETVMGSGFATLPGGKGLNQAVAAARAGAETVMLGRVGNDAFGRALLDLLRDEAIDATQVGIDPAEPTGIALITVCDGDNTIVVASGANMALAPGIVGTTRIGAGDVCVAQMETPVEVTEVFFARARSVGARTVLNVAPALPVPAALLAATGTLIVNESELAAITGTPVSETDDFHRIASIARSLVTADRRIVVTLGKRGVLALAHGSEAFASPGHAVDAVDSTGAGDCFVGTFAARLVAGDSPEQALRHANAAAAIAVTRRGAAPAMPRAAEVRVLLGE